MYSGRVKVASEQLQLSFQVRGIPKEQLIQVLLAEAPNQALNKGMTQSNQLHPIITNPGKFSGLPIRFIHSAAGSSSWCELGTAGQINESGSTTRPKN